jgi:hypothetical protein
LLRGTLFFVNPSGAASKVAGAVVVKKELQTEAFYKKVLYKGDYKGALYLRGSSEAPHSKVSFLGGGVPLDLRFRDPLEAKSLAGAPNTNMFAPWEATAPQPPELGGCRPQKPLRGVWGGGGPLSRGVWGAGAPQGAKNNLKYLPQASYVSVPSPKPYVLKYPKNTIPAGPPASPRSATAFISGLSGWTSFSKSATRSPGCLGSGITKYPLYAPPSLTTYY